jgi:hypothetical protein
LENLTVSEHKADETSGEPGSLSAGPDAPISSDAQSQPVAASAPENIEAPGLVPGQGAAVETPKVEAEKAEADKPEAAKVEAPKADAPRTPGKVLIMSAGDRGWEGKGEGAEVESEQGSGMFGKRRLAALAAVVALAALAGALGGALATVGLMHFAGRDSAASGNLMLQASVARIDADILALKVSVEHTTKMGMSHFNKTSDRLDKVEKAQAEPAAKLARLSEAVDKLRAAPPAAPTPVAAAPVAAKEATGSIAPPAPAPVAAAAAAPVPLPAPKPEVARLPTVEGWVLRDVANGSALIEGRRGMWEVYAGDPIPGLGRVDAIRKQDGRWVVVTSKGLIVAR